MTLEVKILVGGRVQGVRFRQFVYDTALKLGVTGYVQNKLNGTVLAIGQGSEEILLDFLTQTQRGSLLSKVESFSYVWRSVSESYSGFSIRTDKPFLADQKSSFVNLGKRMLGIEGRVPRHVAIIPDGNRRWAKERGLPGSTGHAQAGNYDSIYRLVDTARETGVHYLTFWLFSTENWKRDKQEVDQLFTIILRFLKRFEKDALKHHIKFQHIGRRDRLPETLCRVISHLEQVTAPFEDFHVQVALDYGGRDEVVRAVNKLIASGVKEVSEKDLLTYLDTKDIPDVDLIIRTSGEYRTSGFMPVQGAYAEFYFTDIHFPDFGSEQLREAIHSFGERKRRFGGN
jgi:undecaprenyl diphosphate synthase